MVRYKRIVAAVGVAAMLGVAIYYWPHFRWVVWPEIDCRRWEAVDAVQNKVLEAVESPGRTTFGNARTLLDYNAYFQKDIGKAQCGFSVALVFESPNAFGVPLRRVIEAKAVRRVSADGWRVDVEGVRKWYPDLDGKVLGINM